MAIKVREVVDRHGQVWSGKVVDVNRHEGRDLAAGILTLGMSDVLFGRSEPTITVEVNGERHVGYAPRTRR